MSPQIALYPLLVSGAWLAYFLVKNCKVREAVMLLLSVVLYATWGLGFLGLLIASCLMNFGLGIWLRRNQTATRLWVGIFLNVALLSTFKYLPGISSLLPNSALHKFSAGLLLPAGISFWTFQALSYLFDIYRGEELDPSLPEFLLYMAFWPTVLSGPICRLSSLLPQFRQSTKVSADDVRVGFDRVAIGLVMIALGQALGGGIRSGQGLDQAFDRTTGGYTGLDVWCLAIGYGFELFFNFAGYSHIVIGAARMFGIRLDENFADPYASTSPSEFWTRWHMSLSFWIRDYLFLPLATLKRQKYWRHVALLLSMIVFGLWHRGTLLLMLWGAYHGVLLVLHRQWQQWKLRFGWEWSNAAAVSLSWLVTFGLMCFGWIFFRANSVSQMLGFLRAIVRGRYVDHIVPSSLYLLVIASVLGYFAILSAAKLLRSFIPALAPPMELRFALYALAFYVGVLHTAQTQAFIYFQF